MLYTNSDITRDNPSCFLFIIDQSSSMAQFFGDRRENATKAEGVALALNNLLRNLIITCSKSDGVRNYFDIGVIGYGQTVAPAWGGPLAGQELVPIRDVAAHFARVVEKKQMVTNSRGQLVEQTVKTPVWVEPRSGGSTLMCEALSCAHRILAAWTLRNSTSFPPVVVHITDGEATDGNPAPYMAALTELGTTNGRATLFNVHLSSRRDSVPTSFPDSPDGLPDAFSRMLFEQASTLTPFMRSVAWNNGLALSDQAKAFVMNADPTLMVLALEIGTRPGNLW
jgi:hypothetical protein